MKYREISGCDIFCTVVDNYGDIGVCWRLAKQLANEYGLVVRLWVDDLGSFGKLCPDIVVSHSLQKINGVEVRHWAIPFAEVTPLQLVIEAFACELPQSYVLAMARCTPQPVWLNLEYLTAEDWVDACHGLPSPHPVLPLVKYFFFPGFNNKTGGLLIEKNLLIQRDEFLANPAKKEAFWQSLDVPVAQTGETRVSLFSYDNPAVHGLFGVWSGGSYPVTCLVPESPVLPRVAQFFGKKQVRKGDFLRRGNLCVYVLPFIEQSEYDKLLWSCDFNFVRGEDSCVRAQWAAKPFAWHIYPQHDGVHLKKLHAMFDLYCRGLEADTQPLRVLWEIWNTPELAQQAEIIEFARIWNDLQSQQSMLEQHGRRWSGQLSSNSLALNLLDFSHKVGRIAPFKI